MLVCHYVERRGRHLWIRAHEQIVVEELRFSARVAVVVSLPFIIFIDTGAPVASDFVLLELFASNFALLATSPD